MKIRAMNMVMVFLLGMCRLSSDAWAQGSLTPPGAPAPTMKTLTQVEPRTPISSAAYYISQPGSYYLTTNLTAAGNGVVIAASGVTLDLMGFTITGDRGSSDSGVYLVGASNAPIRDVVVRNGIVRNFGRGVHAECSQDSRFEQLIVSSNNYGVVLSGYAGQCKGNTIDHCTISGSGQYGVYLSGYAGQCNNNIVTDCAISGNGSRGMYLDGTIGGACNGNTIARCMVSGNGGTGVYIDGWLGKCHGNTIVDCMINENAIYGIDVLLAEGNRVEGNHVRGQTGIPTYGIYFSATAKNLILRNTCVGQTNNFTMSASDTYGPIVTNAGELATSGAAAHPWANFSR